MQIVTRTMTGTALFLLLVLAYYAPPIFLSMVLLASLLFIGIVEWPRLFHDTPTRGIALLPLYPALSFLLMLVMNHSAYRPVLFFLWLVVACFDTCSYIFGKLCGKRTIAPRISPRKTWEGFIGGLLSTLLLVRSAMAVYSKRSSLSFLAIIALICIAAFLGDLFESWLKRRAGIKDSSSLLPGHGGLLDRLDGVLAAVWVAYLFQGYLLTFLQN